MGKFCSSFFLQTLEGALLDAKLNIIQLYPPVANRLQKEIGHMNNNLF